jgi:hypothetical protein
VLESKIMRRIFRTKRGEVTEVWIGRKPEGISGRKQEGDIKLALQNI